MSARLEELTVIAKELMQDITTIQQTDPDNKELITEKQSLLLNIRAEIFELAEEDDSPDLIEGDDNIDDDNIDDDEDEDYDEDSDEDSDEDYSDEDDFDEDDEDSNEHDTDTEELDDAPVEISNKPSSGPGFISEVGVPQSTQEMINAFAEGYDDLSLTKGQQEKVMVVTQESYETELQSSGTCQTLKIIDHSGNEVTPLQKGDVFVADIPLDMLHLPPSSRLAMTTEDLEISIREVGQIESLHVIPLESKNGFIILHGKRRYVAAQKLGLRTLRAVVDNTRNKTWLRYLELITNCTQKPYNFTEIMTAANFISSKQPHLSTDVIDRIIGLPAGSYLKGKMLLVEPVDIEILAKLSQNKLTLEQAYKALTKKQEKAEKEAEKLAMENGVDLGDLRQNDYGEVDRTPNFQTTGDGRRPLERWLSEAIEMRDTHTCQCCGLGKDEPFLSCIYEKHHMIPVFKKGPDSEDNLILLCKNCHAMVHAFVDGKFFPPQGREEEFHNVIVLAKIITDGPGGYAPYDRYLKEYIKFW